MSQKLLICVGIFLFALVLRLWNLNAMGRTWDEGAYVEEGYKFIHLVLKHDFNSPIWYNNPDHPPFARYLYGIGAQFDIIDSKNGIPVFRYDYTFARLFSVVFSSLSVVLVVLMGWRYYSRFVGIASGIFLAMIPFYLGFSQIATLETFILFFFTAAVYSYLRFLEKYSLKLLILTGIFSGLALLVKQTNILLFPLFILIYGMWFFVNKKNKLKLINKQLISTAFIPIIAGITFIVLWPMPFLHLHEVIEFHNHMWVDNVQLPPPEVFFGRLMLVPLPYYPVMFVLTTPILLLALFIAGLKGIDEKKNWILFAIIIWFLLPFLQSFYPFKQHGVRYIIEIYAPLVLLCAIGLETIVERFTRSDKTKYISLFFVSLYLFVILFRLKPYYLDYFNEIVGGSKGVYEARSFQLGWWGQGTKEAVNWIATNGEKGSRVGILFNQLQVTPRNNQLQIVKYDDEKQFDYVVVQYFSVLREGFDDGKIKSNYKKVHSVFADGAPIVDVYKKN